MKADAYDLSHVERPRRRRLVAVVAVVAPLLVVASASVWFIRSYVLPPMITIGPMAMSSADATPAQRAPLLEPETTGSSPAAAAPNWPAAALSGPRVPASIWDSVPLPGPPRQAFRAEEPAAAREPVAVPLPPRRPSISTAEFDLPAVPLPRPRPALASN